MDDHPNNALRIVLVGKTGSGKSAMANTILGTEMFVSKISAEAVTKSCQKGTREWKGRHLLVVDTPGLFDTKETLEAMCAEISKCVLLSCPGPHAIVLVMQLGRYTMEEQHTVALIKAVFGKEAMKNMILLFTRKEELEGRSLDTILGATDKELKTVIRECGNRTFAISNKADEAEKEVQVQNLVELIEKMVKNNGGTYFSNAIYEDTEERMRERAKVLKEIYTKQGDQEIQRMEMEYRNKSEEEKKEKTEYIKRKYDEIIGNTREEAEKDIFKYISEKIRKTLSKI